MAEVTIVGAGLSGLVAAINLARRGHQVTVLERESRIGGSPLYHPSGQGSPLFLRELTDYIGVDISPAVEPIREMREVPGGKVLPIDPSLIKSYFFERGPRSTSVDSYLYGIALEEGVRVEFNRPVLSQEEMAQLPPNTIVATGLHFEGFNSLGIPYLTSHHFTYKGTCDPDLNFVNMYHDSFTTDYGYSCAFRGIRYVHLFNRRRPISREDLERFSARVREVEGMEVPSWNSFTFPVPAATPRNPVLFHGEKILAGTLAGAMDPANFFGLHGALVTGKIAALAIEDKYQAWVEFRKCTRLFAKAFLARKFQMMQPFWMQIMVHRLAFSNFQRNRAVQKGIVLSIPGILNLGVRF